MAASFTHPFHTISGFSFILYFDVHLPLSCVAHYIVVISNRHTKKKPGQNEDLLGADFTPIVIIFSLLLFTFLSQDAFKNWL